MYNLNNKYHHQCLLLTFTLFDLSDLDSGDIRCCKMVNGGVVGNVRNK